MAARRSIAANSTIRSSQFGAGDMAKKSSGKKMVDRYSHTTGDFFALHFFAMFFRLFCGHVGVRAALNG
jgi:hypothetical protein